jgi:hypothetical protein
MAASAASQIKSVAGVRGIHVLCGGHEELAASVMQAAGLG